MNEIENAIGIPWSYIHFKYPCLSVSIDIVKQNDSFFLEIRNLSFEFNKSVVM